MLLWWLGDAYELLQGIFGELQLIIDSDVVRWLGLTLEALVRNLVYSQSCVKARVMDHLLHTSHPARVRRSWYQQ